MADLSYFYMEKAFQKGRYLDECFWFGVVTHAQTCPDFSEVERKGCSAPDERKGVHNCLERMIKTF